MYMMEAPVARVNRRVGYPPAATGPPLSLSPYPWGANPAQLDANSSDLRSWLSVLSATARLRAFQVVFRSADYGKSVVPLAGALRPM